MSFRRGFRFTEAESEEPDEEEVAEEDETEPDVCGELLAELELECGRVGCTRRNDGSIGRWMMDVESRAFEFNQVSYFYSFYWLGIS